MSTMTRSATLTTPGDTLSLASGPLSAAAIAAGARHPQMHESMLRADRHAQFTVSAAGVFTGARYSILRVGVDLTESAGASISPADSTPLATVVDFPVASLSDVKVRLDALASGSITLTIASTRPGSEAAPGASVGR